MAGGIGGADGVNGMFAAIRRALPTGFVPVCRTCHDAWVGSFLLIVIAAIIVAGIGFGAAAFTIGGDRGLTPPRPDGVPFDLPPDRPLDRADVEDLRLDTTLRGYRMSQVDLVLERVSEDFDFLYARIADLEDQLAGRVDEDEAEDLELELPSWAGSGPTEADAGSGEVEATTADTTTADTTTADTTTTEAATTETPAAETPAEAAGVEPGPTESADVKAAEREPGQVEAADREAADREAAELDATDLDVADLTGESEPAAVPRPSRSGGRRG